MSLVGDLEAVDAAVAWVAVAVCWLGVAGLAVSWVIRRRRPAATGAVTGPGGVPPGPATDPGEDVSFPSCSADTRRAETRSTDRR